VGLRTAKELAFTGKLVSADDAADLGLVNDVVAHEELDEAIDDLLETLATRPSDGIALAKEAIHANLGRPWRDGLEREAHVQALAYDTDAHREGVTAFLEDRQPQFD
jgi:enoyl-CoA hydratase/carnithine racemase